MRKLFSIEEFPHREECEVISISCVYLRSVYSWKELYCIPLCESEELFGVCPMVFPFTLKGFFYVNLVFFIFVFIFLYDYSLIWYYSHIWYYSCIWYYLHIWVLFILRQQPLPRSSVGAIEANHSSTQHKFLSNFSYI